MHAYGGAKAGMARSLASIAAEGWIPTAAMLGTAGKPPMWASVGLRPVAGTTIDFKVSPPSLSEREKLLMLSCWDAAGVPGSALSQWLTGIDVDAGPDGRNSLTFVKQAFHDLSGGHLHAHVWARSLWGLGRAPWMSIHLSKPMLGKSPVSTADTCHSEASALSLIVSRASSHQD